MKLLSFSCSQANEIVCDANTDRQKVEQRWPTLSQTCAMRLVLYELFSNIQRSTAERIKSGGVLGISLTKFSFLALKLGESVRCGLVNKNLVKLTIVCSERALTHSR